MLSIEEQKAVKRERHRLYIREWRATNPEKAKAISKRQQEKNKLLGRNKARYYANIDVMRARSKAHYEANKPKILEHTKAWQAANPEKVIEAKRKWRRNNVDKQREATRRWAKEHPVEVCVKSERHRARKINASGEYTVEQLKARVDFYGGRCAYCKAGAYEGIDHVIPLARGGSNWPANLRPACLQCNSSKNNRLLSEWSGPPACGWPKYEKAVRAGKKFAVDMRVRVGHLDTTSGVIF